MPKDPQAKKWQITINNPTDKGLDHVAIKEKLSKLKSIEYYCLGDEKGKTEHTHLFVYCSRIRFSTLKRHFPEAHIEQAYGTAKENRDYVAKTGKWEDDAKAETSLAGTFEEWGELPQELGAGYRSDIAAIYQQIDEGKSNYEIISENPDTAAYIEKMDKIRQTILEAENREKFRELEVTYIYGPTATGKTRYVMEKNGYSNVYRVTDYTHPFDRYNQSPVLLFDEFRSSLQIGDMLDYLDGYPLMLPARYAQRVACYTEVYIVSNIDLREQYPNVQINEPETWRALLRRVHHVIEYRNDEPPVDHGSGIEYIYPTRPEWKEITGDGKQEELPF